MRSPRARNARGAAAALATAATIVIAAGGPAGAAIGPVGVAPSSGPPGTTFTVSGSGCGPGLFASSSDYVSVSSTSLPLDVHVPVNSAGSWSRSFTVPGGSLPVPAVIAAVCITDGLPSLTTIYTPGTFVVTAATAPTTVPPPPPPTTPTTSSPTGTTPTTKGTTASTKPGSKGSGSGSGGGGTGTGTRSGSSSAGSGRGGSARSGNGNGNGGGAVTAAGTKRSGAVAGLRSPELVGDTRSPTSGMNGWWWALLAVVVAGAIGTWLWLRRRDPSAPGPAAGDGEHTDPGEGTAPDDVASQDDGDDDWPSFPVLDTEPTRS